MQAASVDTIVPRPMPYSSQAQRSASFTRQTIQDLREVVYVIDQDFGVVEEMREILVDLEVISVSSASEYHALARRDVPACLVLSLRRTDPGSVDLQRRLTAEGSHPPVILLSEDCDSSSVAAAFKAGAFEFLTVPLNACALSEAVYGGLVLDRKVRQRRAELSRLQHRLAMLTPRERQVLPLIVGGLLNKQAASVLGIAEVTLQIHRSQIMRKMEAQSFADLVRMAVKLRIQHWRVSEPGPVPTAPAALYRGRVPQSRMAAHYASHG
ncbi:MAG TPA: LuxR C-terminal-related transcriptional regulator [Acidisarcina sp.]